MKISAQNGSSPDGLFKSWSTSSKKSAACPYSGDPQIDHYVGPSLHAALTCPKRRTGPARTISDTVSCTECTPEQRAKRCLELLGNMRDEVLELSKQVHPSAAPRWAGLRALCQIMAVNFHTVVYYAVEQVLEAEDWRSAKILWEVLPFGMYAEGRVACAEDGLWVSRNKLGNGPGIIHADLENGTFFIGHLIDGGYKSGVIRKIV
jgi:hypothetical protein